MIASFILVILKNQQLDTIIRKKKPINAAYSDLIEKFETNLKAPKFKANGRVRITKYKNIFIKVTLKIGQKKYLLSILC